MVKYGPAFVAEQQARFRWQDGSRIQAEQHVMRLQPPISTPHKKSQALVSESAPAPHGAQPDPLQSQDSPIDSEDGSGPDSPPAEPTLASILHAIQDCKASLPAWTFLY